MALPHITHLAIYSSSTVYTVGGKHPARQKTCEFIGISIIMLKNMNLSGV